MAWKEFYALNTYICTVKKVLILAYDFPPYVSVGALRPNGWYKFLKEFDVYPIIVTRQWKNTYGNHLDYIAKSESNETIIEQTNQGTIIRTPYQPNFANRLMLKYGDSKYRFIRRAISGFYEFAQYLFFIGPKSSIYHHANDFLKTNKVDAILATGDPFILFKYASALGKKYDIPWIADYRDPWSQNFTGAQNIMLKMWFLYFEKKIVVSAELIVTVSLFLKYQIASLIKDKNYLILPNGYDPEAIDKAKNIPQNNETLSFAFIGSYYEWYPVKTTLSVIGEFLKEHPEAKIEIKFYGINIPKELTSIVTDEYPELKQLTSVYPNQPNNELILKLAKDNIMLLFNNYFYMGTKIFDYIGIKRAILFCFSNDSEAKRLKEKYYHPGNTYGASDRLQEELIVKTKSGYIIKDSKHLLEVIGELYQDFISNGSVNCTTIDEEHYSRKSNTKLLADMIKKISTEGSNKN